MAAPKETAEEQLLRMIEGPKSGSSKQRTPRGGFSLGRFLAQVQERVGLLRQRLAPAVSSASRAHADIFLWRLRLIDRVFWIILVALGAFVVLDLLLPARRPPASVAQLIRGASSASQAGGASSAPADQQLRPVAEYREVLASKDPFGIGAAVHGMGSSSGSTAHGKLQEMVSKLAVVGMNRGQQPEALIEDSEAKRTYFLKVGDAINGMTVKAIGQSGVTLTYEGEETTIQ